jgi:SAM-dependent methyltransferase/uncharacterized protein YbaR (Trm112 family)
MRRAHFAALAPICPVCRADTPLAITATYREQDDDIIEGILGCTNHECQREYPIVDGIPILVGAIRGWLAGNPLQILLRDDLSPEMESLLGDVLGPASPFDTIRHYNGIYASDHYEGGVARTLLARALDLAGELPEGPAIDTGCATGGTTFELAQRTGRITVGVDLNFAMLRVASRALREGVVRYPRRRVGIVYDRREVAVPSSDLVDFWCCDVAALPFRAETFAVAASLNVLDCTPNPRNTLAEMSRIERPGGKLLLTTPYDWTAHATPVEQWLGGHSQRGPDGGAAEPFLRSLLAPDLELVAEELNVPWQVRTHERSTVHYDVHLIVAAKRH